MTNLTLLTAETGAMGKRQKLYIEGVEVHRLLDELYPNARIKAERKHLNLRFEIIAWEPLSAAADRRALSETLNDIIHHAIEISSANSDITLRSYPSHNDAGITFEIAATGIDLTKCCDLQNLTGAMCQALANIQMMGGNVLSGRRLNGSTCVTFWIPQWIVSEEEFSQAWLCAA